ncbi:MAG: hypothetical protein BWY32_03539 [bacterium ADurb.Bin243]|nr:MAG: hypothetical protein BWY32_03539 [bacterium ADurb.Bin243]
MLSNIFPITGSFANHGTLLALLNERSLMSPDIIKVSPFLISTKFEDCLLLVLGTEPYWPKLTFSTKEPIWTFIFILITSFWLILGVTFKVTPGAGETYSGVGRRVPVVPWGVYLRYGILSVTPKVASFLSKVTVDGEEISLAWRF